MPQISGLFPCLQYAWVAGPEIRAGECNVERGIDIRAILLLLVGGRDLVEVPAGLHPNKIGGIDVTVVEVGESIGIEADTGRD